MHDVRWLDLDGVDNMRDVGGIPTLDGGRVAAGRLIRSDNLQDLSPDAVEQLVGTLGVTDIVDLRTFVEVAREGPGPLTGRPEVQVTHLTLYPEESTAAGLPAGERELPWADPARRASPAPATHAEPRHGDHDRVWTGHYLEYLHHRPDSVVGALRTIADASGAVVVHCAAGKDRTGLIVGMALTVAGAGPDDVAADYAASAHRVAAVLERLRRRPAYRENLATTALAEQTPKPETMRMLLHTLDRHFGGVGGWLLRHGWTAQDTTALRAKLR